MRGLCRRQHRPRLQLQSAIKRFISYGASFKYAVIERMRNLQSRTSVQALCLPYEKFCQPKAIRRTLRVRYALALCLSRYGCRYFFSSAAACSNRERTAGSSANPFSKPKSWIMPS